MFNVTLAVYLNNMILSNTLIANVSKINWLLYHTFGISKQALNFMNCHKFLTTFDVFCGSESLII